MSQFEGYQKSLFTPGLAVLVERATQALEMSREGISEELKKQIDVLKKQIQANQEHAMIKVQELDRTNIPAYLAQNQELLTEMAICNAKLESDISNLTEKPQADAFIWLLKQYDLKQIAPKGTSTNGSLDTSKVYKVSACDKVRYYLPFESEIMVFAGNGKSSEKVMSILKDVFPELWPTSVTALQRLHYQAYHTTSKVWPTVMERLETANAHKDDWAHALGMTKNTNGLNDATVIDKTPEVWLSENPVKEK